MRMVRLLVILLTVAAQCAFACTVVDYGNYIALSTLYGTTDIHERVIIDLIKSPAFERLKKVRQYGVTCYARQEPVYTRYEHSLGVFFLLRTYGANLEEQIDGLLHDVSHTAFSHVADHLFNCRFNAHSYQDDIHMWYLEQAHITPILHAHGYDDACSDSAKAYHRCLEQDKPDLCADRVEYNLHGGLIDGLLTHEQARMILGHLHFEHEQWFFDDVDAAILFADVCLTLSLARWGALWNVFVDYCASQALKRALALGVLESDTIHFSDDDVVWARIQSCNDAVIHQWLKRITSYATAYTLATQEDPNAFFMKGKCSRTNPLVKTPHGLQRLTELNEDFAQRYDAAQEIIDAGYYITLND